MQPLFTLPETQTQNGPCAFLSEKRAGLEGTISLWGTGWGNTLALPQV